MMCLVHKSCFIIFILSLDTHMHTFHVKNAFIFCCDEANIFNVDPVSDAMVPMYFGYSD